MIMMRMNYNTKLTAGSNRFNLPISNPHDSVGLDILKLHGAQPLTKRGFFVCNVLSHYVGLGGAALRLAGSCSRYVNPVQSRALMLDIIWRGLNNLHTRISNMKPYQNCGYKSVRLNPEYLKNSIRPLDFYRHHLPEAKFKKIAWNDGGLCPFHSDNNTGSFRVNLATGAFTCFACGTKGGDIIAFTMALHGLEFVDALAELANDWGIM